MTYLGIQKKITYVWDGGPFAGFSLAWGGVETYRGWLCA